MTIRNVLTKKDVEGNPATNLVITVYIYDETVSNGCGNYVGQMGEIPNVGQYYLQASEDFIGTILVDGNSDPALRGIPFKGGKIDGDKIKDAVIGLNHLTQAAYDYIGVGPGTITNNPDDVTLETKPSAKIGIHDNYLDKLDGDAAASNGIDKAGMWDHIKHNNIVNIKDFGAVGDGVTDDTAALRAAFLFAQEILIPEGTFIVDPTVVGDPIIPVMDSQTVRGKGAKSIIKVKASAGTYRGILGKLGSKLSNFTCDGIVFDHNCQNNSLANYTSYGRYSIFNMTGWENITLINNTIINSDSVVSFYFTKATALEADARDIIIDNNKFLDFGHNASGISYDVSVININGFNAEITNNIITRNDWALGSAFTGIEVSLSHAVITNNVIRRFQVGMNITGMWRYTAVEQSIISDNVMDVSRDGIILWSEAYDTHTTGYGINGMLIANNTIRIRPKEQKVVGAVYAYWGGIRFFGTHSGTALLDVKNIKITGNQIIYDEDTAVEYASVNGNNGAIGWYLSTGHTNITYEDIEISNNYVIGSPQPAVWCEYGKIKGLTIKNNEFVNCGTSLNPAAISTRKVVIGFAPDSIENDIIIKDNIIRDTNTTGIIEYIYYLKSNTDSTNKIQIIGDVYDIKDITSIISTIYSHPSEYFDLYLDIKKAPNIDRLTWYRILEGSRISVANIEYKAYKTGSGAGNVWHARMYGSAAPGSGTWYDGDEVLYLDKVAGSFMGEVCTTTGTSGTWKTFGAITA